MAEKRVYHIVKNMGLGPRIINTKTGPVHLLPKQVSEPVELEENPDDRRSFLYNLINPKNGTAPLLSVSRHDGPEADEDDDQGGNGGGGDTEVEVEDYSNKDKWSYQDLKDEAHKRELGLGPNLSRIAYEKALTDDDAEKAKLEGND